jgi:NAD(P)-dependent dehydrogenase (short-subunit alcohol dehydrogenase family)
MPTALVIGSSAGIGLATARRLLGAGWTVGGLARRAAPIDDAGYRHWLGDVRSPELPAQLAAACDELGPLDACVYATGVGRLVDLSDLSGEPDVFAVNLSGLVITASVVLPRMLAAGRGHLLGLSSQADRLIDAQAPSYNASKAAMSSYLEGLALACRPRGVHVTNVRFGFVDTEMSRSSGPRPFLISAERAAELVERCLRKRPIRFTYPLRMAALLWLVRWPTRLRIWAS